jgi:hypothetical protein
VPWAVRAAIADSAITSGGGGPADGDWTVNGDDMYATVSGSVGIGTTSPDGKAEVSSGSTSATFCNHFFDGVALADFWSAVQGSYSTSALGFAGLRRNQLGNNWYYGTYGVATGTSRAYGAWGRNETSNNYGYLGGYDYGAHGFHSDTGNYGYLGTDVSGVYGVNKISGAGDNPGVYGENNITGNYAYLGGDALAAYARHASTLNNVQLGGSGFALRAQAFSGDAALFYGDVHVLDGRLSTVEIEITGGADLSEHFDVSGRDTGADPEPGYVVSIDPERPGQLAVSREAYDRKVAGIISGAGGIAPGLLMGQQGSVAHGRDPVALSGRVYCWADASRAPIAPGDLLTTSDVPGHAMKATDYDRAQGAIVGKAMTSLAEGRGLVLVLVRPQ